MKQALIVLHIFFFLGGLAQTSSEVASAEAYQAKMNRDFKDPEHSPLPPDEIPYFEGLEFFPVDPSYIVTGEFVRTPFEVPFAMPTTTERKPLYVKYGEIHFKLKGKNYKLNVYQSQDLIKDPEYADYLFLPFTDLTNGKSTYAGGRYLDMSIPTSNRVVLNFNKSYNPYCAYSGNYSCPIPPKENHLEVPVEAGIKAYHK